MHSGYSANHSMTWAVGVHLQECTRYRPVSIEQMVHTEPSAEQSTTRPAGEHMDEFESFDTKSFVGRLLGKGDWGGFMDKIKVARGVPDAMTAHRVAVLLQQSACLCSCHDSGYVASLRPDQSLAQPQCLQDMPCSLCLLWRRLACCTTGQSEAGVETPGTMRPVVVCCCHRLLQGSQCISTLTLTVRPSNRPLVWRYPYHPSFCCGAGRCSRQWNEGGDDG